VSENGFISLEALAKQAKGTGCNGNGTASPKLEIEEPVAGD
jgi:hypothetical protein